jgi:O-antigen ligase/tetratricopeptide (TPR) repeat protein
MMKRFLLTVILLLPVLYIPGLPVGGFIQKWFLAGLFSIFFLSYIAVKNPIELPGTLRLVLIPFSGLLLAHIVSLSGSLNIWAGVEATAGILVSALCVTAAASYLCSREDITRCAVIVTAAGLIVSGLVLLQFFGITVAWLSRVPDLASTLGHRNAAADFHIIHLPVALWLAVHSKKNARLKCMGFTGFVLGAVHLLSTLSRGAWVGLSAGAVFAVSAWLISRRSVTRKQGICILAGLIITGLLISLSPVIRDRVASIGDTGRGTNRFRLLVWESTVNIIRDNPVFGTGAGTFFIHYPYYRNPKEIVLSGQDVFVHHAHNEYLETAAETGLIGLFFLAWTLVACVHLLVRAGRGSSPPESYFFLYASAAFTGACASAFFNMTLRNPVPLILLSCLTGLAACHTGGKQPVRIRGKCAQAGMLAAAVIGAVILTAWTGSHIFFGKAQKTRIHSPARAIDLFISAHTWWPGEYQAAYQGSMDSLNLGRLEEALRLTEQSLESHPGFINTLYNRARILELLERTDDATDAYGDVLQLDPGHEAALNNTALILEAKGSLADAERFLDRAAAIYPYSPETRNNQGIIAFQLGRYQKARESFEAGARMSRGYFVPRSTVRHFSLLGQVHFRATIDLPGGKVIRSDWGRILFSSRPETPPEIVNPPGVVRLEYLDAGSAVLVVCDFHPEAILYTIDYKIKGFDGTFTIDPMLPVYGDLWNNLGIVQERLNDMAGAKKSYSRALFMDSSDRRALSGLSRTGS